MKSVIINIGLYGATYVVQEVVDPIEGDFASDGLCDGIYCHMELIPKHVKNSHRTENLRRAQFLFHDNGL